MNDSSKRDQWDRHNRDEAKQRAAQQERAGPGYRPVPTQPYANLAGSPEARDAEVDLADLIGKYEQATAVEREKWVAVRDVLAQETGTEAWNAWRDAVERTQEAARSLVNHENRRLARS